MNFIHWFMDVFLHLDRHLADVIQSCGVWTYALLFLIVFCETGLVITPVLPGDSLLFATGALAAGGSLDVFVLAVFLSVAAILGDTANYWIGKYLGRWIIHHPRRWVNQKHIDRTHAFFEKYGGKTIIIARFVPIIRTFAPFVAGVGAMTYFQFLIYNVVGGVLWVGICLAAGYWLGTRPVVKENFSLVILAIVFISILPALYEFWRMRASRERS
ncbi:MAG: DedA family protein [Planctomycetes bacterium]|nr:DedA family protein [Planctomycetota bacterium]MBI3832738.1 DedA family protein [Planctomycetota bacterium]